MSFWFDDFDSIDGRGAQSSEQFNQIDLPTSTNWTFDVILTWRGAKIKEQLVDHNQIKLNHNLKRWHTALLGEEMKIKQL